MARNITDAIFACKETKPGKIVSDDIEQKNQAKTLTININQEHELEYWAETLGTTREEIVSAVNAFGPIVKDVIRFIFSLTIQKNIL